MRAPAYPRAWETGASPISATLPTQTAGHDDTRGMAMTNPLEWRGICGPRRVRVPAPESALRSLVCVFAIMVCLAYLISTTVPVRANWLSELARLGERSGVAAGRIAKSLGELDGVAALVAKLPAGAKASALAAEALPEGGWRFVNAAGEVVTAADAVEMQRALSWLVPDVIDADAARFDIYLTKDTVFRYPEQLASLPSGSILRVVIDDRSYPLITQRAGAETRLFAEIGSDLAAALHDPRLFEEALWQLRRPLARGQLRVLSLDPDGARSLPKIAAHTGADASKAPETVNPYALDELFRDVGGQTVIVTGQVEGEMLRFAPVSGGEKTIVIDDLMRAAADNDVSVVLLKAHSAKQPGRKTWLMQPAKIADLDKALSAGTMGEFLSVLAKGQGRLLVEASDSGRGYVRVTARAAEGELPRPSGAEPGADAGERFGDLFADLVQNVAGQVVTIAAEISVEGRERREELERRIVPGIPSGIQYTVLLAYVFGILGLGVLRRWWRRLLPLIDRSSFPSPISFVVNRVGRSLLFLLLALPLAGPFAFVAAVVQSLWDGMRTVLWLISAPFRWFFGKRGARA